MSFFALAVFKPETVSMMMAREVAHEVVEPARMVFAVELFFEQRVAESAANDRAAKEPGSSVFVLAPVYETIKERL